MRILLDTHTFLWWHGVSGKLSPKAKALCEDWSNELYISVASIWEIQIKAQAGKLKLNDPIATIIENQRNQNHFELLSISLQHVLELNMLPEYHRDPFDRILVAQAQYEKLVLVTDDSMIKQYPVTNIW